MDREKKPIKKLLSKQVEYKKKAVNRNSYKALKAGKDKFLDYPSFASIIEAKNTNNSKTTEQKNICNLINLGKTEAEFT